jgi:hypothetical protein
MSMKLLIVALALTPMVSALAVAQSASDCFDDVAKVSHFAVMYAARVVSCQSFPSVDNKYRGSPMSVTFLPYKVDSPACRQMAVDMSWIEIKKAEADPAAYCPAAIRQKYAQ